VLEMGRPAMTSFGFSAASLPHYAIIYIFIHHNVIERTQQKVQQKSTQKKKK